MISMPDSTDVAALPGGYPAYLGYADGRWPTEAALRTRFPHAQLVILTVTGTSAAHGVRVMPGIDVEPSNPNAEDAARWVQQVLEAPPAARPVIYAGLAIKGYSMMDVLTELTRLGIARNRVRLLTAHWGRGEHICGPHSCGQLRVDADGTQWTDAFAGVGGRLVDMSVLRDDFFGTVAKVTDIPLNVCGSYTDAAGRLYVIGTNAAGVLCESKRTSFGVWSAPYPIAGKTGA